MAAAAPLGATRLVLIAGLLTSCGATGSSGPATRTRTAEPDGSAAVEGGADPECSFTPCGGDVVGTWTIQRVCPVSIFVQNCPTVALDPRDVAVTGSFTFGADGTLTIDIRSSGTWDGVVPSSCVAGTDCQSIAGTLFQPNAPPATCTSDGDGGCACSSPATPQQTGSRPYSIAGMSVASMSFCVEGDVLKLMNEAGTVFVSNRSTSEQPPP
jgi:hypothetical protein